MESNLKVNDEIFLDIKRIGINGEGIGYYKKLAVFVKGALPKENVFVKIVSVNPKYALGELLENKTPSDQRCEPFCKYYGKCGGCNLEHVNYKEQGNLKREILMESISRYSGLNPRQFEVKPTIIMDNPLHYRTKVSVPVRNSELGVVTGLYAPNSRQFIKVTGLEVTNQVVTKVNVELGKVLDKFAVKAYDPKFKKGLVRYFVTRTSLLTKETQVTLIVYKKDPVLEKLADDILKIDSVVSYYYSVNDDIAGESIFGKELTYVAGKTTIVEKLGDYEYELLPDSFFQLNPVQAKVLYDETLKACKLSRKENVLDAFCGVGSIGIYLAKMAKEVVGIEANKAAVENARNNAKRNKLTNIRFIEGNATKALPYLVKEKFIPDVMVFDPPRTGMTDDIKEAILKCKPKRIVYVSCNPATLAKDLKTLSQMYQVNYIQPVDMFPHQALVESVVSMTLRNDNK